jgi:hypothetical protein
MNNHFPYIWRKNYRQQRAMAGKSSTDRARKSPAVFEPHRYIINRYCRNTGAV